MKRSFVHDSARLGVALAILAVLIAIAAQPGAVAAVAAPLPAPRQQHDSSLVFQSTGSPLESVVALAGGYDFTYALTSDGSVKGWGDIDLPSDVETLSGNTYTAVDMPGLSGITAIAAAVSGQHTCALTQAGGVRCWGLNNDGELGNGTTDYTPEPVDVVGLSGRAVSITCGFEHSCAALESGQVQCWGANRSGQLGIGGTENSPTPVLVGGIGDAVAVAGGNDFTCALTRGGGVKCWGSSLFAGGVSGDTSTTPMDVPGLSSGVQAISAGNSHICALTTEGGVKCWGWGYNGALGVGDNDRRETPTDVVGLNRGVVQIAAGGTLTCAILQGGAVRCWGENERGQVGIGSFTQDPQLVPADVAGLSSGAIALAAGDEHGCAVVQQRSVTCWGWNSEGQLGDGTTADRPSPVGVLLGGLVGATPVAPTPAAPVPATPAPAPAAFRAPVGPLVPEITTYVPTPLDVSTEPKVVGANLILAAAVMLLFAVAAELWTRILGEREEALRGRLGGANWLGSVGKSLSTIASARLGGRPAVWDIIKLILIVCFYGVVFSLLDRTWKPFTAAGVTLFLSMAIAYGLVGLLDDFLQWRALRRWGKSAGLTVRPSNFLMAVISTATTRAISLVPGLMFGTPEALQTDEEALSPPERRTLARISAATFIGIGLLVWLPTWGIALLQRQALPSWLGSLLGGLEALLLVIFAVALENTFVNLLGLPGGFGQALKKRSRLLWLIALILITFVFLHTLLNPRGDLAQALKEGNVKLFLIVAGAFVVTSFGAWLFLWLRRRRAPAVPPEAAVQPPTLAEPTPSAARSEPTAVAPPPQAIPPAIRAEETAVSPEQGQIQRQVADLIFGLKVPDKDAQQAAVQRMIALGAPAVEPLIVYLRHPDPFARLMAVAALGKMQDARALEPLRQALEDPDQGVRALAQVALRELEKQQPRGS